MTSWFRAACRYAVLVLALAAVTTLVLPDSRCGRLLDWCGRTLARWAGGSRGDAR